MILFVVSQTIQLTSSISGNKERAYEIHLPTHHNQEKKMHASNHTWSLMTLGNSMITNHRGSHCFKMAIPLFFFTIIKTHYQHRKAVVICQMTKWKLWSHDKWSKLSGGKTFTKVKVDLELNLKNLKFPINLTNYTE